MLQEHGLYIALAVLLVAFAWAWRAARGRRRRARLKKAMRGVSASRDASSLRTRNGSLRSDMRWGESKSEVMDQLSQPSITQGKRGRGPRTRRKAA